MQISRRGFGAFALGAASLLATPRVARAARTIRLRYGTAFPVSHPGVVRIVEAAEAIKARTDGAVDLQVYPNSQLGGEADMFTQVRSGALDLMSTSGVNQTVVPVASINAVAFAFPDYDHVWSAMDGALGDHVRAAFAETGLFTFPKMLDNGYRNITSSSQPITDPASLAGMKIRVPGNRLWVTLFETLGAAPTPISFGELYAALQTHIVDGQENPLALIESSKIYEVQNYVSLTGHIWDGHHIFANGKLWEMLPEDVRSVMIEELTTAATKERADILDLNAKATKHMTSVGVTFNDVDTGPFRETLNKGGFYDQWKETFGGEAWGLLEQTSGML